MRQSPIIQDGASSRWAGQFYLAATPSFQTRTLRKVSPTIELISESQTFSRGERIIALRVPEAELDAVLAAVRTLPDVRDAHKQSVVQLAAVPNDPMWSLQRGSQLDKMNLEQAWDVSRGLPSVRVAVLDSGVNPNADLNVAAGFNALGLPTTDTSDIAPTGHGTQVASTIGAGWSNGTGIAGIAPGVTIVPVRVCITFLSKCPASFIRVGLDWVYDQGNIQVVNMSFYSPDDDGMGVDGSLDALRLQNIIVVASSGNDSLGTVGWPARYGDVIAVGGTDIQGFRYPASNYGAALDVVAPYFLWALGKTGGVELFGGTSASTPAIAGLAALFKSTQPVGISSASGFLAAMKRNAYADKAWNQETGYGIPNAFSTIWAGACVRFDFNHDNVVDLLDDQNEAFRYGAYEGYSLHYDRWHDLWPPLSPDHEIDIRDLQSVWGRNARCPT